jgi:hypothetical protein
MSAKNLALRGRYFYGIAVVRPLALLKNGPTTFWSVSVFLFFLNACRPMICRHILCRSFEPLIRRQSLDRSARFRQLDGFADLATKLTSLHRRFVDQREEVTVC